MQTVDHKCPNCNANLKYNPKLKGWKCEYCGGIFTRKDLKEQEEKFKEEISKKEEKKKISDVEMDEYYCKDCGAKIIADPNTSATFCVYCKNTAILKNRLQDEFAPTKIIPFSKTKEDAIAAFKKVGKGKILMPKEFTLEKNIQELTGIYIPFWLYSCKVEGSVKGKGTRVHTWSGSNYIYTKTDIYRVERSGVFPFSNIPVDGSVRFNDAVMNSIEPFNYEELLDFSPSYLSGFLAEKYDVEANEAKKISLDRAKESCYSDLSKTNYATFIPEDKMGKAIDEEIMYVLLPVWMVNIRYNQKLYTFAMNGQTGKMIGDIPYSRKKAVYLWLLLFVISFIIIALVTYWL